LLRILETSEFALDSFVEHEVSLLCSERLIYTGLFLGLDWLNILICSY